MKLKNNIGLIGDFLGTVPVMQAIARTTRLEVVGLHDEIMQLWHMIDKRDLDMTWLVGTPQVPDAELDLEKAFAIGDKKGLHMTQAHFAVLGMEVPDKPIRPILDKPTSYSPYPAVDYIISPFSRCLPDNQRWPKERWQELVDEMYDSEFMIVGSAKDDTSYLKGLNVTYTYGAAFRHLSSMMKSTKKGLISVVTGTSHLAYAIGVKNYLFCNQGAWGKNPEAEVLSEGKPILDITVKDVIKQLKGQ